MDLPDTVTAIGEQLAAGGALAPDPELFEAYDVFAAELARIFTRPWLALDHHSRLAADGDYVRAEVGSRSVVVVRERADRIHALRNACLHAGYRVCEADSGRVEQLYCQYHGWSYALDGRLTDPLLRPDILDRSRFRLPHYAMRIERGLIFVDLSALGAEPPPAGPIALGAIPEDLGERPVHRRRYQTTLNWKRLRQFLWARPELALGVEACDATVELGPLSLVAIAGGDAALLRLAPRFPGHTDVELIAMPRPGRSRSDGGAVDPLADALREEGEEIAAAPLDRDFLAWYWPLMAPAD